MSAAQKLDLVATRTMPLGGVHVELMRSACGNRIWSLRSAPPEGTGGKPVILATGFGDTGEQRADLAGELRALAAAVEDWP
ncbi:hypothetical protein [Salipiger thiooxidans]|uniref:hypothetical protein n=1 Tax=Salipiger thiooxidans TaxID=282683 RepID=UPI001CD3889E|nr:hypothetical protein [Salipiger thiooxidans]MCA0851406.1 hypothetical protein [Salipiger thiooxidans]